MSHKCTGLEIKVNGLLEEGGRVEFFLAIAIMLPVKTLEVEGVERVWLDYYDSQEGAWQDTFGNLK